MTETQRSGALFEVSWEVCNKVGGIYTVVASKALSGLAAFGENYWLLGPDLGDNPEFEETAGAGWEPIRSALKQRNLKCRLGHWKIPGRPKIILVNAADRYDRSQLLYELWSRYGVDSLSGGWDYVEPVMFSAACAEAIDAIWRALLEPSSVSTTAHFHEWLCGAGLLTLKHLAPAIGTVFTTHATVLGRSMAGAGHDIYRRMGQINPTIEAGNLNVTAKCSLESQTAKEAHCFTTVSALTGEEAGALLGRSPDLITPNGLDLRVIPGRDAERAAASKERILEAVGRLLRRPLDSQTKIFIASGRYEFHNKGLDLFLDALKGTRDDLRQSGSKVLALFAVMGGHAGVDSNVLNETPDSATGPVPLTAHRIHDPEHDPILTACRRLGLDNAPDDPVQIVFIPAQLDGADGFLNMPYEQVLEACDLGVFPSWYEPWGYTPQEAAAWGVPTVTTDLAGFGLWAREQGPVADGGVRVLPRRDCPYEKSVAELRSMLTAAGQTDDELATHRAAARALIERCSWNKFYPCYLQAYERAGEVVSMMVPKAKRRVDDEKLLSIALTGTPSAAPTFRQFTAVAELPERIGRLRELADNLWWTWHPECWSLFADLAPDQWERSDHNPVVAVDKADLGRLDELSKEHRYLELYDQTLAGFDRYMSVSARTDLAPNISAERPIAYFSTEYGLHECLSIYSGGLGVLSGDHLKAASDLNLPLVAVGLLYKTGYFRQELGKDGRQVAQYPTNDFGCLPISRVLRDDGEPLDIQVELPGRSLFAQIWMVRVGRIKLYLMDTDTPRNRPEDRRISERLYVAERDSRIRQEILLGMGGVRLTRELGLSPAVWHMNEGHSAFLVFERLRELMTGQGHSLESAVETVRGDTIFTTHTPVEAGNERFTLDLMHKYFSDFAASLNIPWTDFVRMGVLEDGKHDAFEMTLLALNHAFKSNGVSQLHGYVSRQLWARNWKGLPTAEVPIGYVTNGVHTASYMGPEIRELFDRCLGDGWMERVDQAGALDGLECLEGGELWSARRHQKERLVDFLRDSLGVTLRKLDVSREDQRTILQGLRSDALIIGFARRFAPYKRANLILADLARLKTILGGVGRPVILVFSGKAHPADGQGNDLIQQVVKTSLSPDFLGKIFFVEDYNLAVSRLLVQGCDLWLNTPRRPYEASGTSGEKAGPNGVLNFSVADGWWCEAENGHNGWTIGPRTFTDAALDQSDYADAESLYAQLEEDIVPTFFERNEADLPVRWLEMMRDSLQTVTGQFSARRMVLEYLTDYYQPAAGRGIALAADGGTLARQLAAWKNDAAARFSSVKVDRLMAEGLESGIATCAQPIQVAVTVDCGAMEPRELSVQIVAGPAAGNDGFDRKPDVVTLSLANARSEGRAVFTGRYVPRTNGRYEWGVRLTPTCPDLASPLDSRLVLWA